MDEQHVSFGDNLNFELVDLGNSGFPFMIQRTSDLVGCFPRFDTNPYQAREISGISTLNLFDFDTAFFCHDRSVYIIDRVLHDGVQQTF